MNENLFFLPDPLPDEECTSILVNGKNMRIEKIISCGSSSPPGFLYDQQDDEWVSVIQGNAVLTIEDKMIALNKGDNILIPAHTKHRIESTSVIPPCIWVCVFGKFDN